MWNRTERKLEKERRVEGREKKKKKDEEECKCAEWIDIEVQSQNISNRLIVCYLFHCFVDSSTHCLPAV